MNEFWLNCLLSCYLISSFSCNNIENEKAEVFNSFAYLNYLNEYPIFQLNQQYSSAFLQHERIKKSVNRRSGQWEWIGPKNIHGRVLSLAINPQDTSELWAGTASSGLWKSVSGGLGQNNWKNINLPYPVYSISSIAIDPFDPNTIYIGTGESYSYNPSIGGKYNRVLRGSWGIGILKSIDGGNSWKISLDWSKYNDRCVWKIIIDPKNHSNIYATGSHGIFKSTNYGKNWIQILDKKMTTDLIIHPDSNNILMAGVGGIGAEEFGIYKTTDFGESWSKIAPQKNVLAQGRIMLSINKLNPNKVYALLSDTFNTINLLTSNNLFNNYTTHSIQDITSYQGWYAKGIISDATGKELMIGGVDLFVDRTGTFNNFIRYQMGEIKVHGDFHDIISNPLDLNKIYFATDGGIFRSNDFGKNFIDCNDGLNNSQFYSAIFTTDGQFGIGGLQDNRSAIYNQNLNWALTHYGDGTASLIHPMNENIIFCSSQNLYLSRSVNQGNDWQTILIDPSAPFVPALKMSNQDPNIIYTGSNKLYQSTDNGIHFNIIQELPKNSLINTIELSSYHSNEILFSILPTNSTVPKIYYSVNSGYTISDITSNLPERVISDISMVDENTFYVCLTGFGTSHIFKTINKGKEWIEIDAGLPDIPFHTIWVNPFNFDNIFAGSDLGLYFTNDGGKLWESTLPSELKAIPIYDLNYIQNKKKLAVVTHGKGVYFLDISDYITTIHNTFVNKTKFENLILLSGSNQNVVSLDNGYLISIDGKIIQTTQANATIQFSNLSSGIYYFISRKINYRILKL